MRGAGPHVLVRTQNTARQDRVADSQAEKPVSQAILFWMAWLTGFSAESRLK
jgi:hypothetical protein